MSDGDAIFGEGALGLDLAKADLARAGSCQAPTRRSQRSSGQAQPDPPPDRQAPARSAAAPAGSSARPVQRAGPSLQRLSPPPTPPSNPERIFPRAAPGFPVRGP